MTWIVLTVLLMWAIGYATDISGPAIHVLLFVAAIVFAVRVVNGRKMA